MLEIKILNFLFFNSPYCTPPVGDWDEVPLMDMDWDEQ